MMHQPIEDLKVVDIAVHDRGSTWCFKPETKKGEKFCLENMGALSEAQRVQNTYCVSVQVVISLVHDMTEAGLYVKEVSH